MGNEELVAGRSVEAGYPGQAVAALLGGFFFLAVLLILGPRNTESLVFTSVTTAFYALVWGVANGVFLRRQLRRLPLPPIATVVRRPGASDVVLNALVVGLIAVVAVAVIDVVMVMLGEGDVDDLQLVLAFVPGASLGLAVAGAVAVGGLRAWQDRHGVDLYVREGARRFAWTRAQARERLVAVARPGVDA